MNRSEALAAVKESITELIPDDDFSRVAPDDKFRESFELD